MCDKKMGVALVVYKIRLWYDRNIVERSLVQT